MQLTLNTQQVAAEMGVSRTTVLMWKRQGLVFDCGNRATLDHVLKWRQEHRELVASHARFQPLSERPAHLAKTSEVRARARACRSDAPLKKRGSRAASRPPRAPRRVPAGSQR